MNSNIPTVRQVAWISLVPHFAIMGILIFLYSQLVDGDAFIYGALTYLALSYLLKYFIGQDYRIGIRLFKQSKFQEAIPFFEKSYDFFKRYDWVGKYRFITMLSSSKMTYKEMALNNIAFCYGQSGDGIKAKEYYERTLIEYPDNGLAKASLRLMTSLDNQNAEKKSGL